MKVGRIAVAIAAVGFACCVEDRGYAADIAAHLELLKLRDQLVCHQRETGGFPETLEDLVIPKVRRACPVPDDVEVAIRYSQHPASGRYWHGHSWTYRPVHPDADGRKHGYELSVIDMRGRSRYRSFWLDDSGVVRSATGRPAGAGDQAEQRQDASR